MIGIPTEYDCCVLGELSNSLECQNRPRQLRHIRINSDSSRGRFLLQRRRQNDSTSRKRHHEYGLINKFSDPFDSPDDTWTTLKISFFLERPM